MFYIIDWDSNNYLPFHSTEIDTLTFLMAQKALNYIKSGIHPENPATRLFKFARTASERSSKLNFEYGFSALRYFWQHFHREQPVNFEFAS